MQMLAPLDQWLEPAETDQVLIMRYAAQLRSGALNKERQPVMWRIAARNNIQK